MNRQNSILIYTGFHAANYNIFSIPAQGFREVVLNELPRDYSMRKRKPFIFSAGGDDGKNRLKPYQYHMSPYKPVYTLWDISPFVAFSPAYITDSIGETQLRGGMKFLIGELSGTANLNGYLFAGKSFKNRPGISWGAGLMSNIMLPKLSGQSHDYQPSMNLSCERHVIGVDQEFKPDPVTADRKPYQSWYIRSSNGPDTLIGQYIDFSHGSFRYSQTFDMVGAIGGVKFDRFSSVNADFFMQNIHIKGDILNATQSSQIRAFSFLGHDTIYNSLDITDMIRDDSTAGDLAWFIKDGTFDLNPFSMLNFYDHFMIYKDYQVGISYLYENYRPAQLLYNRVSRSRTDWK